MPPEDNIHKQTDNKAENPHNLPYASNVGSAIIKPEDEGKLKSRAVSAMEHQTHQQLEQIYEQMELLAKQADKIKSRVEISEKIYKAEMRFEPFIGHTYFLYQKENANFILSMIGNQDWGKKGCPYNSYLAKVKLLADHTWEILETNENE